MHFFFHENIPCWYSFTTDVVTMYKIIVCMVFLIFPYISGQNNSYANFTTVFSDRTSPPDQLNIKKPAETKVNVSIVGKNIYKYVTAAKQEPYVRATEKMPRNFTMQESNITNATTSDSNITMLKYLGQNISTSSGQYNNSALILNSTEVKDVSSNKAVINTSPGTTKAEDSETHKFHIKSIIVNVKQACLKGLNWANGKCRQPA